MGIVGITKVVFLFSKEFNYLLFKTSNESRNFVIQYS